MKNSRIDKMIEDLDIINLNFNLSEESLGFHLRKNKSLLIRKSIVYSVLKFFPYFLKFFITYSISNKKGANKSDVLFLSFTKNQKDTAEALKSFFPKESFYGNTKYGIFSLPEYKAFLYSIKYFPKTWGVYKKQSGYVKDSFKYMFWHYWLTYGYARMLIEELSNPKIRVIVISNDHVMFSRLCGVIGPYINKPIVYIQHASVSSLFPSLIFDYAILEGQDASCKYQSIGNTSTEIIVAGKLIRDTSAPLNKSKRVKNIAVAFGILDSEESVLNIIEAAIKLKGIDTVHIRPHPSERRNFFSKAIIADDRVIISDSKQQSTEIFLSKIDLLISGDSNIQLDAILKNVEVIYYQMNNKVNDYYGFLKNKTVLYKINKPDELISCITKINDDGKSVRNRGAFYDASIGSEFDFKTPELYAKIISDIANESSDYKKYLDHKVENDLNIFFLPSRI